MLRLEHCDKSFGERAVLRDVSLQVDPGHRAGLVGENGVGKSTLLRILAGLESPDAGQITVPDDLGYLDQELPFGASETVKDLIESALAEVRAIEAELDRAAKALGGETSGAESGVASGVAGPPGLSDQLTTAYDAALRRAELAAVWDVDVRVAQTFAGLGLAQIDRNRRLAELSGGERSRCGLAALLIRQPDALLLDEPTNHLDDAAAEYLAMAIKALPGVVLVASHDRVFLDEVCTEILDLDPARDTVLAGGGPVVYGGSYRDYLTAKRKERAAWEVQYAAEQEELRELRRAAHTTARQVGHNREIKDGNKMAYDMRGERVVAQVSRRVRNVQERLSRLEAAQVRKPPPELKFAPPRALATSFGGPDALGASGAWRYRRTTWWCEVGPHPMLASDLICGPLGLLRWRSLLACTCWSLARTAQASRLYC